MRIILLKSWRKSLAESPKIIMGADQQDFLIHRFNAAIVILGKVA